MVSRKGAQMKTATIQVERIPGTNEFLCHVMYKGKVLKTFKRNNLEAWQPLSDIARYAREWAHCQGFTHYKRTGDSFK